MSAPAIVYDGFRLLLAATARTPRGIDRVDFAYASNLVDTWPGDVFCLMPAAWGLRLYDRDRFRSALDYLTEAWRERADPGDEAGLQRVLHRLAGHDDGVRQPRRRPHFDVRYIAKKYFGMLRTGPIRGRPAYAAAPRDAIYLNISQLPYAGPMVNPWLRRRGDIRPVYLMHDVIPIEHPDLVAPMGTRLARAFVDTVREHAAGLIFTTNATRDAVLRELGLRHAPAMLTLPLPIAQAFLAPEPEDPALRALDYFIVCSAIDLRKNHLMLLETWRELARRFGDKAPKLAVIGSAAWAGSEILTALEECGELRRHVVVASGLSTPSLRRLIAHARALLLPSRAEGFGLPVIEALTLGTPVVLSDIPALREVAGARGVFLGIDDQAGWTEAIARLATDQDALAALRSQVAGFRALRDADYFAQAQAFLHTVPARARETARATG